MWEQHMNVVPGVDCYFIQPTYTKPGALEQVWLEDNTLYIGDPWYDQTEQDRILFKTIKALEHLLPYYTHFIRTNLNTFLDLNAV